MKRTLTLTSLVIVAALSLPVLPAAAQERRGGGGGGGGGRAQAAPRPSGGSGGGGGRVQAAPRPSGGSGGGGRTYSAPAYRGTPSGRTYSAPAYRGQPGGRTYAAPQALPRSSNPRNYGTPQAVPGTSVPRNQGSPQAVPRSGGRTYGSPQAVPGTAGPRSYQNGGAYRGGTAIPRNGGPAYGGGRAYVGGGYRGGYHPTMIRPYFSHNYYRPYGWRPYYPYHFVRPYYVFSPWLDLGFGIWCGFPVPYPWVYLGDYQPTVFGTYYTDVQAVPSAPSYGGVSFDIQPNDANLYVDGQYVGVVGSFGPSAEPLTLEPGAHRIAIQRDGYRPLEWDITIQPGQVIPYRGVMEPL